ncbi:nitrate reductase molybdenum cofactor assembly chaperone [Parafrigoribacterium soli]|uniref:nitrate reductase molybdenum cofactor assembly chaperone n=1 Tax=Parafrigoribacterium soli TaxID=3144663 RepID=UPI0032EE412C
MIAKKVAPRETVALELSSDERAATHMAASILLDYPHEEHRSRFPAVAAVIESLPGQIRDAFRLFLEAANAMSQRELEAHFTSIFDQKRKCSPYLTYYTTGDTRKRGMALVRFIHAYRAAGWEVEPGELPDYLPTVLEFSARSESPIADDLIAVHREGIQVLRAALETFDSPYAHVLDAVCLSLPEMDDEARERYMVLINEGPPAEMVGLTYLGALKPFAPAGAQSEDVMV